MHNGDKTASLCKRAAFSTPHPLTSRRLLAYAPPHHHDATTRPSSINLLTYLPPCRQNYAPPVSPLRARCILIIHRREERCSNGDDAWTRSASSFAIVPCQNRRRGERGRRRRRLSTSLPSSHPRSSSSIASSITPGARMTTSHASRSPPHLTHSLRGVIFDLDGTLVEHAIDFADI